MREKGLIGDYDYWKRENKLYGLFYLLFFFLNSRYMSFSLSKKMIWVFMASEL